MELIQTAEDRQRAIDILEMALEQSPGMTWMIKPGRKNGLRNLLRHMYEVARVHRGNYMTSDKSGVVLIYQSSKKRRSVRLFCGKLKILFLVTGIRRGIQLAKVQRLIRQIRPNSGWHALLLASDERPGNAATNELRREVFTLADSTNEPIYLETTRERMHRAYQWIGFKVYNQIKHPYEDTHIWFLRRDPFVGYKYDSKQNEEAKK